MFGDDPHESDWLVALLLALSIASVIGAVAYGFHDAITGRM